MASLSDTPPTPIPKIPRRGARKRRIPVVPAPLPALASPDEETTQRRDDLDQETSQFVKQPGRKGRHVVKAPTAGPDPSDDLGFDRPLFAVSEPDTNEAIDTERYEKLVAATRNAAELDSTPPYPTEIPPPQMLFEVTDSTPDNRLDDGENTFTEMGMDSDEDLLIPLEATQQPGVTAPSVLGIPAYRDRRQSRNGVLLVSGVLFAVALGILAGVLLRTLNVEDQSTAPQGATRTVSAVNPAKGPGQNLRTQIEALLTASETHLANRRWTLALRCAREARELAQDVPALRQRVEQQIDRSLRALSKSGDNSQSEL